MMLCFSSRMNVSVRTWLSRCLLIGGLMGAPCLAEEPSKPKPGDTIADLRFKDIRYVPRSLRDFGEKKAIVIVFTNTTCPIVQKYWPKLKRLSKQFESQGVQFVSMNSSAGDEVVEIAQQAIDYDVAFPFVKDLDGSCAKALGVARTPEVVILDAEAKLRYRGRIDDQHRLGGAQPEVKSDDLASAITAVLESKTPPSMETPVDGCEITFEEIELPKEPVTYHEIVAPLLQNHCVECHRPNGGSPLYLTSYEEVSQNAEMIAEVVNERRMPPWFASRKQHFANERGLTASERATIVAWAKAGRKEGDPKNGPAPRKFNDSAWEIGEPDLKTTAVQVHKLPAEGFIDYKYVVMPHIFVQDTWISACEIKPSNPGTVHHCNMAYWAIGQDFNAGNFITGRVPGGTAMILDDGIAFKIPAGSVVGLQIHYTTSGKEETNQMSVGFRFPRMPIKKQLHHVQCTTTKFEIPAGASAHPVSASRTLPFEAHGMAMFAHMHLRGKDMTFKAVTPDGAEETLLSIPNYHYDWQQNYRYEPGAKTFPKGTRIDVTAHFDNSAFNPFNPDAKDVVKYGPQTIHEMMFGFFFYTDAHENLNLKVDEKTGVAIP
jgi:peroxiredoxin